MSKILTLRVMIKRTFSIHIPWSRCYNPAMWNIWCSYPTSIPNSNTNIGCNDVAVNIFVQRKIHGNMDGRRAYLLTLRRRRFVAYMVLITQASTIHKTEQSDNAVFHLVLMVKSKNMLHCVGNPRFGLVVLLRPQSFTHWRCSLTWALEEAWSSG